MHDKVSTCSCYTWTNTPVLELLVAILIKVPLPWTQKGDQRKHWLKAVLLDQWTWPIRWICAWDHYSYSYFLLWYWWLYLTILHGLDNDLSWKWTITIHKMSHNLDSKQHAFMHVHVHHLYFAWVKHTCNISLWTVVRTYTLALVLQKWICCRCQLYQEYSLGLVASGGLPSLYMYNIWIRKTIIIISHNCILIHAWFWPVKPPFGRNFSNSQMMESLETLMA